MANTTLIELDRVEVAIEGNRILSNIDWKLHRGENWLIEGRNGSGKTTFLRLICGLLWPSCPGGGTRVYRIGGDVSESPVGLEGEISYFSPEMQARYSRQDWDMTGEEIVLTGSENSDMLYRRPRNSEHREANRLFRKFGMEALRKKSFSQISQGQLRKLLLLRAVAGNPSLLVLDEICGGLDGSARREMLNFIDDLSDSGRQFVMTANRREETPRAVTHIAYMEDGKILRQGRRSQARVSRERHKRSGKSPGAVKSTAGKKGSEFTVKLLNASVYLSGRRVLSNVDWTIMPRENWAVTGPNGAGKTTLLKLIYGDYSCAAGGAVDRILNRRTLSVIETRQRIGYVSAELQSSYIGNLSVAETVASGFHASIGLIEEVSPQEWRKVRNTLKRFDLGKLATERISRLSYGQVRLALLARAAVIRPLMLLLDEPFEGLDEIYRREMRQFITDLCVEGAQLIMISHHQGDFPHLMTHKLHVEGGWAHSHSSVKLKSRDNR